MPSSRAPLYLHSSPLLPPTVLSPGCLTPLADRDRLRKSVIKDREHREKTTIERERGRPFLLS